MLRTGPRRRGHAPVIAGYLFQAGLGLQTVALVMACGSLLAAAALVALRVREGDWLFRVCPVLVRCENSPRDLRPARRTV